MKLISVLIILLLLGCENKTQPEKIISNFASEKNKQLFLDSIEQSNFIRAAIEKQKTDLEKLKLNGKVATICEVFYDVYLVGKTYYKVNTFGSGGWDPNDIDSTYFNKNGFVIKTVLVNAGNNSSRTTFYNYGANNKLISSSLFRPEKFTEGVAKNHIFGPLSDPYFRKDTIITIFNDDGYLIEKQIVDLKTDEIKSTVNFVYDFDEKGNWIKCILYQKDIPIGINERTIEYYD